MNKTTLPLILAALVVAPLSDADARGPFGHGGGSRLAELDTDGDGVLSDAEKEAAKAAREEARQAFIDTYDEDEDGVLNEEERAAAKEARDAERAAAKEERFVEIDDDGDGAVTAAELQAALPEASAERVAAVLARYDADESGAISVEEFVNPERPKRGPKAGGRRGGGKKARRPGKVRVFAGPRGGGDNDGGGDTTPPPAVDPAVQ